MISDPIIHDARLLKVYYGDDTGLVSLLTGTLLASIARGEFFTAPSVPTVSVAEEDMQKRFGDTHDWGDVIGYLQGTYDWDHKVLPEADLTYVVSVERASARSRDIEVQATSAEFAESIALGIAGDLDFNHAQEYGVEYRALSSSVKEGA